MSSLALATARRLLLGVAYSLILLGLLAMPSQLLAADEPPLPVYPGTARTLSTPAATGVNESLADDLCKDCGADQPAAPLIEDTAAGGPDEFGYVYTDSDEAGGPVYNFIDIRDSGIPVFLTDDSYTDAIALGFDFPYYGELRSQIYIGSNGLIGFTQDQLWSLSNSCPLPDEFLPNDIIALHWDDLYPLTSGPILYQTFASCPYGEQEACWIVQYTDMQHFASFPVGTFQAILFERGNILLQYEDPGAYGGGSATVGIENGTGSTGLTYACGTVDALAAERAVLFSLQVVTVTKESNTLAPTPGAPFTYTIALENLRAESVTDLLLSDALPPDVTLDGPVVLDPPQSGAITAQTAADLPALVSGLSLASGDAVTVTIPVSLETAVAAPRQNLAALVAPALEEVLVAEAEIYPLPDCEDIADNPVTNCGFEQGDLTGWVTTEIDAPLLPLQAAEAGVDVRYGFFASDPPRRDYALVHGFDGEGPGVIELAQDVALPDNATGLTFFYRIGYDLETYSARAPREFWVVIQPEGGGVYPLAETLLYEVLPGRVLTDSGDRLGHVDISAFAGTSIRIVFRWTVPESFSGPAMFQLDNVFLQQATSPQFVNGPITLALEDNPYSHMTRVTTMDPAEPAQINALELPVWMTVTDQLDGTAIISGTPSADDLGDHAVRLEAVSSLGRTVQNATVTVIARNEPPFAVQAPFAFATPDSPYRSLIIIEDEEGDEVTLQILGQPDWLDAASEGSRVRLNGTPTAADIGEHTITLEASDGISSSTIVFSISVGLPGYLPIIEQP